MATILYVATAGEMIRLAPVSPPKVFADKVAAADKVVSC
jgi:hypothetical protein